MCLSVSSAEEEPALRKCFPSAHLFASPVLARKVRSWSGSSNSYASTKPPALHSLASLGSQKRLSCYLPFLTTLVSRVPLVSAEFVVAH